MCGICEGYLALFKCDMLYSPCGFYCYLISNVHTKGRHYEHETYGKTRAVYNCQLLGLRLSGVLDFQWQFLDIVCRVVSILSNSST